ncbi:hypothetical protein KIF59_01220 [Enterobacter cloacae subsp. cloacae]|nr:hypothetical protein [Enterobacter cloacae subsp. cloacae]
MFMMLGFHRRLRRILFRIADSSVIPLASFAIRTAVFGLPAAL